MANPKYAALPEREAQGRTVAELERVLNPDGPFVASSKQLNRELLRKRLAEEKKLLEDMTPAKVDTDDQRTFVTSKLKVLEEAMKEGVPSMGIPPMPTKQEMWEADAGAIGKHRTWEDFWKKHNLDNDGNVIKIDQKKERGAISAWKDLRRCLFQDREEFDPDVSNVEMFRPDQRLDGARKATFASPFANKTYAQYDALMGNADALSEVQKKVRKAEEAGIAEVPAVEKIYKTQEKPKPEVVEEENEEAVRYICGAEAKNGQICRLYVKKPGDRCRHHQIEE